LQNGTDCGTYAFAYAFAYASTYAFTNRGSDPDTNAFLHNVW
jgi:hypothetical protein